MHYHNANSNSANFPVNFKIREFEYEFELGEFLPTPELFLEILRAQVDQGFYDTLCNE
jgi:hypothetical protein